MLLKYSLIVNDFRDVIEYYSEDNASDMWSGPGEWNLCWHRGLRDHDWEYGSKLGRATGSSQPPKSSLINSHNVISRDSGLSWIFVDIHFQLLWGHKIIDYLASIVKEEIGLAHGVCWQTEGEWGWVVVVWSDVQRSVNVLDPPVCRPPPPPCPHLKRRKPDVQWREVYTATFNPTADLDFEDELNVATPHHQPFSRSAKILCQNMPL